MGEKKPDQAYQMAQYVQPMSGRGIVAYMFVIDVFRRNISCLGCDL